MAKHDPGGLIDETRKLITISRNLCENSRRDKDWSKRLNERAANNVAFARNRRDRKRRQHLLKKSA